MSPYKGTTPEQDKNIEDCIRDIKGNYTKTQKIKICKASVLGKKHYYKGSRGK